MRDGIYWDRKIETMPVKELKQLQLEKLKSLVKRCYDHIPFYRRIFDETGLQPRDIRTLRDLQKLPFTMKADLRENYPFNMIGVKLDEVVEIHTSSGTSGDPTVGVYTQTDVDVWQELMARSLYTAGGRKKDVVHIAFGYGLFTGGLGYHYGAQKIGMAVVPVSVGMTKRQIKLMKDLQATVLCCTPSFAVYLAESMIREGVAPKEDLKLRIGLFGAETWSEKMRERIEGELALKAYDLYGLTELCGPGISIECGERHGLHVWDDHFLVEVIDPNTGEVLSPGEEGELVFTTLTKTGLPLLRYRTRDVSILETDKCGCGRTHTRMMRVQGRSDDMFFVKGVNVFPTQIEYVLMGHHQLALQYQIILERRGMDLITIKVELTEKASKDPHVDVERLITSLNEEIRNVIGIRAHLQIVDPGEIPRSMGKAQRVLDLRKNAF